MRADRRFGWGYFGVAVAAVVGLAVLIPALVSGAGEPCCFNNVQYAGTCTVVPGAGESCQSVLDYLNNPMSTGKSYCGGTSIRGGWAQVDCGAGKRTAQRGAAGSATDARKPEAAPQGGAGR